MILPSINWLVGWLLCSTCCYLKYLFAYWLAQQYIQMFIIHAIIDYTLLQNFPIIHIIQWWKQSVIILYDVRYCNICSVVAVLNNMFIFVMFYLASNHDDFFVFAQSNSSHYVRPKWVSLSLACFGRESNCLTFVLNVWSITMKQPLLHPFMIIM
jgi:uncharacterized membrane protein